MKTLKATLLLLALSLPLWAANNPDEPKQKNRKNRDKEEIVNVPEGGNTITYLLVSGAAIAGVLALRKRSLPRSVNNG